MFECTFFLKQSQREEAPPGVSQMLQVVNIGLVCPILKFYLRSDFGFRVGIFLSLDLCSGIYAEINIVCYNGVFFAAPMPAWCLNSGYINATDNLL